MIIGTRASSLAMAQTGMVVARLRELESLIDLEVRKVKTLGDEVHDRSLKALGGLGAFTKELDQNLLEGQIDVVVNSLKDMPVQLTKGTVIAAVLPRGPRSDVLVADRPFHELPLGAVVGTSSVRRAATVRRLRPDLKVKDLRGNVPTRIKKLKEGQYDAIIVAQAGIERLGIKVQCHPLDPTVFIPSAGQGAIAVVCRDDYELRPLLEKLDDARARMEVEAERTILSVLGGGCYVPIGVSAKLEGEELQVLANIMDERGKQYAQLKRQIPLTQGREGLSQFAADLLESWRSVPPLPDGPGEVYLVGAGPGDMELITVKGLRVLRSAHVVVYDSLIASELLKEAPTNAELIDAGKRGAYHKVEQDEINRILLDRASQGKRVVRLKGGDPFLFGRGGEEAEYLEANGVRCHVVPGVSSAIAVPALAGIPVTHRGMASHVTMITGHESAEKAQEVINWNALAKVGGTLVILMGMTNLRRNMQHLIEGGLDQKTPVAVIEKGATLQQRLVTAMATNVADVCESQGVKAPAIIVVGEVALMSERLGDLR